MTTTVKRTIYCVFLFAFAYALGVGTCATGRLYLDRQLAWFHAGMSMSETLDGNFTVALKAAAIAQSLHPNQYNGYLAMSQVLEAMSHYSLAQEELGYAIELLEAHIEKDPNNSIHNYELKAAREKAEKLEGKLGEGNGGE